MFHPDHYAVQRHFTSGDIPDCIWPSNNEYDIPLLRDDRQADAVDLPAIGWGTVRRSSHMPGTWHFYVDDYRFNHLWKDPSAVMNSGCMNAVEPNFSVSDQMPFALALHRIYQKRWIARLWQEFAGIRIFVDMNVSERYMALNLAGVPYGWRAYATRGYSDRLDAIDMEYAQACLRRGNGDILFIVYGGGIPVQRRCQERGLIWIPEQQDVAKGRQKALEKTEYVSSRI